ncbi:MAG: ATP-binding cassette domain-containing protein [Bacteroidota bacterium]
MSDKLLKTILRLLVIVAKEDDVTTSEKKAVLDFLEENVNKEEAARYLRFFEELVENTKDQTQRDEMKEIIKLSYDVNKELKQEQKLVVLLRLLELIVADEKVTERENELLQLVGTSLNFTPKVVDHLMSFVQTTEVEKFAAKSVLVAGVEARTDLRANYLQVKDLKGSFAFFNVPGIDMYFVKYMGDDSLALNGLPLAPHRIKVFSNGSSIRCLNAVMSPIYFSDVLGGFHQESQEFSISFVADHVNFLFPNGNKGLTDFNLAERNGKLIGIMGGSGSGKSTLLNVLNGNAKPSEGSVRINGIDIHRQPKKAEGIIGYVPQDDLLIEDLTVYQNLYYAAKLCFEDYTEPQLEQLVDKVLGSLGLRSTRNLKVGNPLQKTISGGQRKRLNIGLELLREPSVLFVDEPTSGLSSRDSENIMDLLKELALKGKMVFVVIHQPSSDIFKMFDKLVILDVGGFQIYYGNPVDAVTYFKSIADHVDRQQGACFNCGNVNPEQIFNIIDAKVVDEYGRFTQQRKVHPKEWHGYFQERVKVEEVEEVQEDPPKSLSVPNWFKQLAVFTKRDFYSKLSNRQYLLINLLEAPLLALILAVIVRYSPVGEDYSFRENINIPVFFFISVIVALFMGLTVSAEEIIKDRKILKRESFLNLSRSSYLTSKILLLFTLSAIQTLLFTVLGAWILEIKGMTLSYWLILFSVSSFANLLGLNISSAFNSVVTIYILIPLLIIPQLILSGVVVSFDKLNAQLSTKDRVPLIGEIMASRWAYEALAVSQFKNNQYTRPLYAFDQRIIQSEYETVYYLPELEEVLEEAIQAQGKGNTEELESRLQLLRSEIGKELAIVGEDKFDLAGLTAEQFNTQVAEDLQEFIGGLKNFYNRRRKTAESEKDQYVTDRVKTPQEREAYAQLRRDHENDRLTYMLRNTSVKQRVLRTDKSLVRQVYPVYARNNHPKHVLDFRTKFYYPEKHIFGVYMPTKIFNVIVIWLMTALLYVTLYYDVLRKIVSGRRES